MPKVITVQELRNFSSFSVIQNRADDHLTNDIIEAEAEIYGEVGHYFEDTGEFPNGVPEDAKLAYLKLAQFYALINSDEAINKGYKGETLDNYSYTLASTGEVLRKPDMRHLIDEYKPESYVDSNTSVNFRMRSL